MQVNRVDIISIRGEVMIKIAVCDDEKNVRNYIRELIIDQDIDCEIKEFANSSEYFLNNYEPDILVLDIDMGKDSASGMELADLIRKKSHKQPLIIFITGYPEYVFNAFDVEAFHYLLKPIDEKQFARVMQLAITKVTKISDSDTQSLEIQHDGNRKIVPLKDISYIESQNHKAVLHINNRKIAYYARIGELEEELSDSFCRIHKGYLVNLAYVDEYSKSEVTLTTGEVLLISKYKYKDFVRAHMRFVKKSEPGDF